MRFSFPFIPISFNNITLKVVTHAKKEKVTLFSLVLSAYLHYNLILSERKAVSRMAKFSGRKIFDPKLPSVPYRLFFIIV